VFGAATAGAVGFVFVAYQWYPLNVFLPAILGAGLLFCLAMSMSRVALRSLILPSAVTLIFLLLTWPVWRWLWQEWLGNDYYSHGLLIPPVALYLAIQRLRNDRTVVVDARQGGAGGLILLSLMLVLFLYFVNGRAYYLAAVAMIGLLASLVWSLGGLTLLRKLIFPIGYLLLMAPLPFIDRITLPLALFTGECAGGLVRFLGLDFTNAEMVIGAQCSGINSMIALTALLTLTAYLLDGPMWGRIALVLMAVPLAMLGNILRVASLLFVARLYGANAAFTYYHDYSGILFFLGVFLLMFPLTRLLQARTLRLEVI
jgi:exosortase